MIENLWLGTSRSIPLGAVPQSVKCVWGVIKLLTTVFIYLFSGWVTSTECFEHLRPLRLKLFPFFPHCSKSPKITLRYLGMLFVYLSSTINAIIISPRSKLTWTSHPSPVPPGLPVSCQIVHRQWHWGLTHPLPWHTFAKSFPVYLVHTWLHPPPSRKHNFQVCWQCYSSGSHLCWW